MKSFTKEHTNIAKGVAIFFLLIYHLYPTLESLTGIDTFPLNATAIYYVASFGNICVPIFLFLSAYGITVSFMNQSDLTIKKIANLSLKRFLSLMLNFFLLYASFNLLWFYKFDYSLLYGIGRERILHQLTDALGLSSLFNTPTFCLTWWYMTLAYSFIFIIPFLYLITKKIGYTIIPLVLFTPFLLKVDINYHLYSVLLGVLAAYGNWFEFLFTLIPFGINKEGMITSKPKFAIRYMGFLIIGCGLIVFLILFRHWPFSQDIYLYLTNAFAAILIVYFSAMLIGPIPVLNKVVAFIGSHSFNIFLIHTFFFLILWKDYIYYFDNAFITWSILLIVSLAYSVVLEWIKKVINIKKLFSTS